MWTKLTGMSLSRSLSPYVYTCIDVGLYLIHMYRFLVFETEFDVCTVRFSLSRVKHVIYTHRVYSNNLELNEGICLFQVFWVRRRTEEKLPLQSSVYATRFDPCRGATFGETMRLLRVFTFCSDAYL